LSRGRRDPQAVAVGDAIDFWRVAAVEPGKRLTLLAEMRLPGSATPRLELRPEDEQRTRITVTGYPPGGTRDCSHHRHALGPAQSGHLRRPCAGDRPRPSTPKPPRATACGPPFVSGGFPSVATMTRRRGVLSRRIAALALLLGVAACSTPPPPA
jgi:hypothetical protein